MKQISISGKPYKLPETWTEIPVKQIPNLLNLLYVLPANGSTYHELLRILLGFSAKKWTKLMRHYFSPKVPEDTIDLNALALQEVIELVSWMWKDEITVEPFPSIEVNGTKWLLFEHGFKTMSFGELSDAYIHSQAFIKQLVEGEDRLNLLIATICRPARAIESTTSEADPDWNGDMREPYNEHTARHRAPQLENGYIKEKIIVLMYFLGSLKEFYSFFDLFESDAAGPPTPEEYPGQSLIKNQHMLSEKHIFGGMAATKSANVHDVFQFLEEHRKDIQAENARIKAAQKEER